MDGSNAPSKIDLRFAEKKVIFLICECSLDKRFSFYSLKRAEAVRFIKRLRYIGQMTWGQFAALDRTNGITSEDPNAESFGMVHAQNTSERKLGEQYYFHFRVEKDGKFRVFGYQKDQFFCITHIDLLGCIHH